MIPSFELARPTRLDEAIEELYDDGVPYVGGTELVAAMHIGLLAPKKLVDLKRVGELHGVEETERGLTIGAATRHDQIAESRVVRQNAPILAEACSLLGNQRVRATGSIGGNICFADRRSDVSTALFALGAELTLQSAEAIRTCRIDEFILGEMDVDRESTELLVSIHIPRIEGTQIYLRHQPAEYPTACVALVAHAEADNRHVELVIGALTERPEKFRFASMDEIDSVAIGAQLATVGDLNGSEDYKRHLAGVFTERIVRQMQRRLVAR